MDTFSSPFAQFNLLVSQLMRGISDLHAYRSDLSLEENVSHHAFVLMAQQMAVEERYAPDVTRISSPGAARMTRGLSRRLNKRPPSGCLDR